MQLPVACVALLAAREGTCGIHKRGIQGTGFAKEELNCHELSLLQSNHTTPHLEGCWVRVRQTSAVIKSEGVEAEWSLLDAAGSTAWQHLPAETAATIPIRLLSSPKYLWVFSQEQASSCQYSPARTLVIYTKFWRERKESPRNAFPKA